jgi:molybdopterin adenylyltransferase
VLDATDAAGRGAVRVGIVTVSDRASRGEYEDRGGPAVAQYLSDALESHFEVEARVVSDDIAALRAVLIELCDERACGLVLTTGGTGPAPRDVTPDVTAEVCDRLLPGFGERMRQVSVEAVPTAILSRQVAGTRGGSLVVNLPGSPRAIAQCLDAVMPAIPHALELIGAPAPKLRSPVDPPA